MRPDRLSLDLRRYPKCPHPLRPTNFRHKHVLTPISLKSANLPDGRATLLTACSEAMSFGHARRFGVDTRVSALCYRTIALWMLGYPDAALTDAAQALKDARKIGHAAVLMHALGHTPRIYAQCGNYAAASALANELISLADEKGAMFWKSAGMIFQGGLFVLTGKAAEAVETIISGITALRYRRVFQFWLGPMGNWANSMMHGAALAKLLRRWRLLRQGYGRRRSIAPPGNSY